MAFAYCYKSDKIMNKYIDIKEELFYEVRIIDEKIMKLKTKRKEKMKTIDRLEKAEK